MPDDLFQEKNEDERQPQQQQQQQTSTPADEQRRARNKTANPSRAGTSYQYTPGQQYTPPPDSIMNSQVYYRRNIVPPPLKFCMEKGHDFDNFLRDFEIYCDHTYPGVMDTWSRVLPNFLEGNMLDAFDSIDGGRLAYYQVKEELRIIAQRASTNKDKLMENYWMATRRKDENISNYAMRLNQLARLAGMDINHYMFKDMKKIKILDALKPESAARVKYTALSEPGITIERIIDLASNAEMCFDEAVKNRQPQNEDRNREQEQEKLNTAKQVLEIEKNQNKKCNYCEKEGHVEAECYKKNKGCFCCGKPGHMIKDCRKRIAQERNRGQSSSTNQEIQQTRREQTGRREQTNSQRYECPFCGENHLMKNCEEFKNMMRRPAEN